MIEVTEAFKNAWLNGRQKHIQLDFSDNTSLGDEDIVLESQSLEQALCTEEQLVFGLTSASCYKISVFNTGKKYKGLKVTPTVAAIDDDNQYYLMSLGEYTIESDVRTDDRKYRELTAYDPLYGILNRNYIAWYKVFFSNTSATHTIKQFRDAFFQQLGIQQTTVTLVNDSANIYFNNSLDSLSGADIIRCICEPNAAFGFINFEGKFQYVTPTAIDGFYPADDIFPANDLYPGETTSELLTPTNVDFAPNNVVYNDYYTHRITQARFVATEHTNEVVVGNSADNCYQFSQNPVLYFCSENQLQAIATNFLSIVEKFFYTPAKMVARGRLWLQLGDVLGYTDGTNNAVIPIMRRKLTGITAFYDEYSANGKEYYTYSVNSYSTVVDAVADQKVKFESAVTFEDLSTAGQTVINGANITTGNINCNRLNGGTISGQTISGGSISGTSITGSSFYSGNSSNASYMTLNKGQLFIGNDSSRDPSVVTPGGNDNKYSKLTPGKLIVLDAPSGYGQHPGRTEIDGNTIVCYTSATGSSKWFAANWSPVQGYYVSVTGDFSVSGTKSRMAETDNYDKRLLYCYEMPTPMFGDIGEGKTDEHGTCYVTIDDVFASTIDTECSYQVFLQEYGNGKLYVSRRDATFFVVEGTPNLEFGWEIKAVQKNYDSMRLEQFDDTESEVDHV